MAVAVLLAHRAGAAGAVRAVRHALPHRGKGRKNAPGVRRAGKQLGGAVHCPAPGPCGGGGEQSVHRRRQHRMARQGLCRAERDPGGTGRGRIARPLAAAPAGRKAAGCRTVLAVPHAGKTAGSSAQRRTGHAAVCPAVGGARLPRGQSGAAVPERRAAAGAGDRAQLDRKNH